MKSLNLFLAVLLAAAFSVPGLSQTRSGNSTDPVPATTESFKVWGKCDMCKARIEKTVKEAGATSATWDGRTQLLTVTFDPSLTGRDAMSKKLASAGHDTEKYKAPDDVYAKLPGCCHYERAK